ncbi:ABC-F family ATP-binding cassette domain-containing protein [Schleiferilactobacillus harbinensis]|uniref:ABC-F family ATP-binding cassette domain-containing protein n=1 Tax=Schleiferilactobacillus harbinensis TaxID=304207 RepID=UPI00242D2AF6|nr:ABC-F family ATP-binding cassette domain-containing protein [Schleiferilactobacillus harbinensis]MCI1687295.1 ABC-F family ATP-binding cassette domain-containing protein [Schleiferilactobacillus harbinensis]MCI1782592.1 ABC-F family ATP-binding cassette domain-containing protein [Schleiferilactobacillus harbinensis]MCI1849878.1 ABC-F family ATP-binding cassette domain-containing protein [Schleiferilactobacillus harbinensis]
MKALQATGLQYAYGDKTLFTDLALTVTPNQRIGLIGLNGVGKSTLLKIIAGRLAPEAGTITTAKGYRINYLPQTPTFPAGADVLTAAFAGAADDFQMVRDYEKALRHYEKDPADQEAAKAYYAANDMMDRHNLWTIEADVKSILTQLAIPDMTVPVATLSGGQQKRVALAQALISPADLLLLDEPTNHLDYQTVDWLEKRLLAYPGGIVFVTHDRYFLDHVATDIAALRNGQLQMYKGNYQDYVAQRAAQEEREAAQTHKQHQLYKQELLWMQAGAQARTTKQKARIERFNSLSNTIDATPAATGQVSIAANTHRLGKEVFHLDQASLTIGGHPIIHDFSWRIGPTGRIGITGINGAGKTTFLNILAGKQKLDAGTLNVGETVRLAYYTQQMPAIPEDKRVIAYITDTASSQTINGETVSASQLLERFLFPPRMHGLRISRLSGGEKRRLYLLKLLMGGPNVLLLDEPTNDLDIETLTILEDYLDTFPGAVITVSHDRYFLDKVCDSMLWFAGQGQITPFTSDVGTFLSHLAAAAQPAPANTAASTKPAPAPAAAEKKKLTYAEQIEYDKLTDQIDQWEQTQGRLEKAMVAEAADYNKVAQLQQQYTDLQAKLQPAMKRWEYLADFAED